MVDFVTFELAIIMYVTVLDNYKIFFFMFMLALNMLMLKLVYWQADKLMTENDAQQTIESESVTSRLDDTINRISIHAFRSLLFIITSVCILAVDFKIFPRYHAKRVDYGISLMDIGVGYFILCHSMRLIRNSDDRLDSNESSFKK